MKNLSHIPFEELLKDLCENERDIGICLHAIDTGILYYKDGKPIVENVGLGEKISETIRQEILNRWKILM